MKISLIRILSAIIAIACVSFMASCNTISGYASSDTGAHTGQWSVEDITVSPELDGDMYSGMVSEGRLYFHHSKTEALLVDSSGSLTWLYSKDKSIFETFDTGDYVRVGHGMIMESYPGQTYISKIALINDGDIDSFTDEEWSRLSGVFVDGLER